MSPLRSFRERAGDRGSIVAKSDRGGELFSLARTRGWAMDEFKGRQFEGEVVMWAVRWCLRYSRGASATGLVIGAWLDEPGVVERLPVPYDGGAIIGAGWEFELCDGRVGEDLERLQCGDGPPLGAVAFEESVSLPVRRSDPARPGLDGILDCLLVDAFIERDVASLALHNHQDSAVAEQLDVGPNSGASRVAHPVVALLQPQFVLGLPLVVNEPVEDALAHPLLGCRAH